ncbi:MAG: AI-2E family transporter [Clostridia bacterium]
MVFSPFITALILVYLLNPIISFLKNKGLNSKIATVVVSALIILLVASIIIFAFPKVYSAVESIGKILSGFLNYVNIDLFSNLGIVYSTTVNIIKSVTVFLVGAVAAFYILNDVESIKLSFLEFIPDKLKPSFKVLWDDVKMILDSFFKGQILVAVILCVMDSLFLYTMGVPYALGLGAIAGLLDIIPYAGAFIGIGIILVVTVISVPKNIIKVLIGLLIIQQIENNIITPKISKNTLKLHPAAVVLVLYVGAFGGFWGILLSVPVSCIIKKFFQRFLQSII